jgi:hypothetical protein
VAVPPRDKERIFQNTKEMLELARLGLADAVGPDARRHRPGLMNLITYGRSVTATIQTIKNTDPDFEQWWAPYQTMMANDPTDDVVQQDPERDLEGGGAGDDGLHRDRRSGSG